MSDDKTSHATEELIASLVDELKPVRPMRLGDGLAQSLVVAAVIVVAVVAGLGLPATRPADDLDPIFVLASGVFLLLAAVSTFTVIEMGRPRVGGQHYGWLWAVGMAALLPATALLMIVADLLHGIVSVAEDDYGSVCLLASTACGLLLGVVLTHWLRRGAPASPERAGLVTGIASGSLGAFAFGLHCPINDITHVGVWHVLAVVLSAFIGRLLIPPLIRW